MKLFLADDMWKLLDEKGRMVTMGGVEQGRPPKIFSIALDGDQTFWAVDEIEDKRTRGTK